jgi:two-component system chemotaxis response regulator CheB
MPAAAHNRPIRVMLVDDSAVVRSLIARALADDPAIQVVATANDGLEAVNIATNTMLDAIILDIEMPGMDGLTALPKLRALAPKTSIIIASSLTERNVEITMKALALGASDIVAKPSNRDEGALQYFFAELKQKLHALLGKPGLGTSALPALPAEEKRIVRTLGKPEAIAIAASTGGPNALLTLCEGLRGHFTHVPVFITQHMPATFTKAFAEHLHKASGTPCMEATDKLSVQAGHIYVAPGNYHMLVESIDGHRVLRLNQDPPENFCRPAADPMLRSLAKIYGPRLMVLVLTGMGSDGLLGARAVAEAGGRIFAQDAASSTVWGMPKAISEAGIADAVLPLTEMIPLLKEAMS